MRTLRNVLVVGAAALTIGLSGAALAQAGQTHLMTVRLPDGGTAQIRYTGNVAPQISVSDAPAPLVGLSPLPSLFGPDSPFAMLDRISAEMDRQAAVLFRQVDRLAAEAPSGQFTAAALQNLPPGSQSYAFVSTMSGSGVCAQSVEVTREGNGPPRVVRHSSGNCGTLPGATGSADLPAATPPAASPGPVWTGAPAVAPPASRPDLVWTSAAGAKPYAGLVRAIPPAQR